MIPPLPPSNRAISVAQKGGAGVSAVVLAISLIAGFEGERNVPYKDIAQITTVCFGHTGKVQNRYYGDAECTRLLVEDATKHGTTVKRCIVRSLPVETEASFISFTYNVGENSFCNSTLVKLANAGDLKGACNQLPRWDHYTVKGVSHVSNGLTIRRALERKLCLKGVAHG